MHVPEWGDKILDDAVAVGNKDAEKALALFTLQIINKDPSLEHRLNVSFK